MEKITISQEINVLLKGVVIEPFSHCEKKFMSNVFAREKGSKNTCYSCLYYSAISNESYKTFKAILTAVYDEFFPKSLIKVRHNKNSTLRITRHISKSSKHKQKLSEKFLKNRTLENEMNYKNYRRLFESVKQKSKKILYTKQLFQFQGNVTKT